MENNEVKKPKIFEIDGITIRITSNEPSKEAIAEFNRRLNLIIDEIDAQSFRLVGINE